MKDWYDLNELIPSSTNRPGMSRNAREGEVISGRTLGKNNDKVPPTTHDNGKDATGITGSLKPSHHDTINVVR